MKKLSDTEITEALNTLPGWRREGDALVKTFERPSFADAVALVSTVAKHADAVDHHPDMLVQYRKLTFTLSTHDANGISARDVELAREIERLAK